MRIIIESDPATAVKVTTPTAAPGESATLVTAQPAVQGTAQDAGACAGVPGEEPSQPTELTVQATAQSAGAFAGGIQGEQPAAVRPQPPETKGTAATVPGASPIIVDDFSRVHNGGGSKA